MDHRFIIACTRVCNFPGGTSLRSLPGPVLWICLVPWTVSGLVPSATFVGSKGETPANLERACFMLQVERCKWDPSLGGSATSHLMV